MRRLADVTVALPLAVALGLLAYVSYVASVRSSGAELVSIVRQTWVLILLLTIPYLAARAFVWYALLTQLGVRVPWRPMAVAFAGGEITKSFPAGVYVQNFLLSRLGHLGQSSAIRSTMATTAMLGLEALVAVPVLLVIGIPNAPWLRETLLAIIGVWIVVIGGAYLLVHYRAEHMNPDTARWRRRLVQTAAEFLDAGSKLITPMTMRNAVPAATYMIIYALELYVIARAAGVHSLSFVSVLGIYGAVVLAVILVPIPTEIGITEFAGLGALLNYGVPRATAALIMLSLRLLGSGMTILLSGLMLVVLRSELVGLESRRIEREEGTRASSESC